VVVFYTDLISFVFCFAVVQICGAILSGATASHREISRSLMQ